MAEYLRPTCSLTALCGDVPEGALRDIETREAGGTDRGPAPLLRVHPVQSLI